jgi:hypothetical protein
MANIIGDSISQQMRLFVAVVQCNPITFKQFDFKYVPVARASPLVLININRKTVVEATKPCFNTSTHIGELYSVQCCMLLGTGMADGERSIKVC